MVPHDVIASLRPMRPFQNRQSDAFFCAQVDRSAAGAASAAGARGLAAAGGVRRLGVGVRLAGAAAGRFGRVVDDDGGGDGGGGHVHQGAAGARRRRPRLQHRRRPRQPAGRPTHLRQVRLRTRRRRPIGPPQAGRPDLRRRRPPARRYASLVPSRPARRTRRETGVVSVTAARWQLLKCPV